MAFKVTGKTDFSPELLNFIHKCDDLDFEVLKPGTEGGLIQYIKDIQVTPYDTGYTEEHNEILQEGRQKVLANTNTDYGAEIYDGPSVGTFHNADHPPYTNANAQAFWLNDIVGNYSGVVTEDIQEEIDNLLR